MIVEQKVKEIENSQAELSVTINKEALQKQYSTVLQKYMKTLQIPGFRKGKVPATVLEQKFGPTLKQESVFTTIDESVQEALKQVDEKYRPLPYSTPALVDEEAIPTTLEADLQFAVTYDIMPQFELPAYTDLEVEIPDVEISDEDITHEIEHLQEQNSMVVEKNDPVATGDIVTIDYVELDAEGQAVEGSSREDYVFTIGSNTNLFELDDDLVGMKAGQSKLVKKTFAENYKYPEYAGRSVDLNVTVKVVKFRDVPALDDEFAQDVSDEYKTVADLKKATKEKLEKNLEGGLKQKTLEAIADLMLSAVEFSVPDSMLQLELDATWRRFISQSGMNEEQALQFLAFQGQSKETFTSGWAEGVTKGIKTQLLMEKIKNKEEITIEEAELQSEVETQLQGIEDENTKSYYTALIEDDLKMKKVEELLLQKNTTKKGEKIPYSQFVNHHAH
ncbi:MAG: trigger factor [Sphaerochaetaceae bacterium]